MLRSFRVANHRSIRAEAELLLMPAYDKERPVVPVAAIFGANASGKSNLLEALRFMQTAVRTSYAEWEPGSGIPRTPFRLDPAAADEPSVYVVELLLNDIRHVYGFEVDDHRVREEWLYAYPRNRRRTVFERTGQDIRFGSTLPDNRSRRNLFAGLTRDNTLFLSAAARANLADVLPLYEWFRSGLVIPEASLRASQTTLVKRLFPDSPSRAITIDILRAADLGISDVIVDPDHQQALEELTLFGVRSGEQVTSEALPAWEAVLRQLRTIGVMTKLGSSPLHFVHGDHGATLALHEQSEGTRAWMALLDQALDALERGSLLLVDEIDSSLHPRLIARLVELFQDGRTNQQGAQLIFATHDATLLGTSFGRDVLRRDQIWFVEKDTAGATTLFPLTDFRPRSDENTERRYLGGSYGAVPAVFSDSLVEAYLAAMPRELVDGPA